MNYPNYNSYYPRYGQPIYSAQAFSPMAAQNAQGYSMSSMPVSSKEEAMAVPADFTGAPMVFCDLSHGKVYIKQWNAQTGSADFMTFCPEEQTQAEDDGYVKQSEFKAAMAEFSRRLKLGGMNDESEPE